MPKTFGIKDLPALWRDYRFFRRLKPVVPRWEVESNKTALLVLDMNYVCSHPEHGFGPTLIKAGLEPQFFYKRLDSTVIPSIRKLLAVFRQNKLKIIYTTMGAEKEDLSDMTFAWRKIYPKIGYHKSYPGQKGFEIRDEVKPETGETVLLKKSSGAFASTNLLEILNKEGIDTLVLTGVETDCCLYNTMIEATDRGIKVIVPDDACSALTQSGHNIFLWLYARLFFCQVKSTKELIDEISKGLIERSSSVEQAPVPARSGSG
ncbi:MAG: isochorismatase family cysteine hydrolase [Dehalococcoidia bacterium]|nr:isochorismatase family cysteine hydrolase [Dehalococcoidia bacterium]